jgi:hypothetical protein
MITGRSPAAVNAAARSGRRVLAQTSCPAAASSGPTRRPSTPVPPAIKILIHASHDRRKHSDRFRRRVQHGPAF